MTTLTYYIEIFGGNKLIVEANIIKFLTRKDPQEHIENCEIEWKRIGYKDERMWPHLFPSTLDNFPNKWYKIEEAYRDTFTWKPLKISSRISHSIMNKRN